MIRSKGEAGTGDVSEATKHIRTINKEIAALRHLKEDELYVAAKELQAPFDIEQQPTIRVTASIGVAFYQGSGTTAAALVKQADEMLYRAKRAGRNNVQVSPLPVEGGQT